MRDPLAGRVTWVERPEDLAAFARRAAREGVVALDTESNSLHAYRERTCIVQVTVGDDTALVDALAVTDLAPLRAALDRPSVEVLLHGGDYDVTVLTRDHDFRFHRLFDTMIAATLLDEPKVSLSDLVAKEFGVVLEKRFQTADWARRPLPPEQLDYLRRDTVFLEPLAERLRARLVEADLVEESEIEFRRLAQRRGRPVEFDPEGWRRLKGAATLDATGRAVLRALFLWREGRAAERDVPPFRVLRPDALLLLARRPPRSPKEVLDRRVARPGKDVRDVLEAVERGLAEAARGEGPRPEEPVRLTPAEREERNVLRRREEALRIWRRGEARRRGVPNVVVLPNPALDWLVRTMPRRAEEIAAHPDVGPKRAGLYADAIRKVLEQTAR